MEDIDHFEYEGENPSSMADTDTVGEIESVAAEEIVEEVVE